MFVYGIRSPYTKESYFRRLGNFFDAINLAKGTTFKERCNTFAYKGRSNHNWAFNNIIRFLHYQKERVEKNEITAGTLHNYVKTIKMFCEVSDIVITWKKLREDFQRERGTQKIEPMPSLSPSPVSFLPYASSLSMTALNLKHDPDVVDA
jgi:hypothetical protein